MVIYVAANGNFTLTGHQGWPIPPRFYEPLINHTPAGAFVTKRIMRGCHVASCHENRRSPSGLIISSTISVKSLNEWQVGKMYLVSSRIVGSSVIVPCLLSLSCLPNIPVVYVNGARMLMVIRTSADACFSF